MMASRAPAYDATPLDVLLASVPSLPRPILARLTARMIERLDEFDDAAVLDRENEYPSIAPPHGVVYGLGTPRRRRLLLSKWGAIFACVGPSSADILGGRMKHLESTLLGMAGRSSEWQADPQLHA